MCNTFAVYFQIFATFGYKKVKNSDWYTTSDKRVSTETAFYRRNC